MGEEDMWSEGFGLQKYTVFCAKRKPFKGQSLLPNRKTMIIKHTLIFRNGLLKITSGGNGGMSAYVVFPTYLPHHGHFEKYW
jgi:hypothetical protein